MVKKIYNSGSVVCILLKVKATMRQRQPLHILLLLLITLLVSGHDACAEEETCTPEALLLEMINDARLHPATTLAANGLNPATLVARLPELASSLQSGMAPLTNDEQITAAAAAHLEDMKLAGYYASESPDGRLPYDRLVEQGYLPAEVKESLSMLGFRNFVDPCRAVGLVFANMLRDEMAATTVDDLKILNPDLREAGIAIGSGTIRSGLFVYHYYHVVCDLALAAFSAGERQALAAVNLARENSFAYAETAGIDLGPYLDENPGLADELLVSLAALRPDARLTEAAHVLAEQMLANDGAMPEEIIAAQGIDPAQTALVARMTVTVDAQNIGQAGLQHVARIFTRELIALAEVRSILNTGYDRIGLHLRAAAPGEWIGDDGLPSPHYAVILVMVFARTEP